MSTLCLREIETSRLDMIVGIVIVQYTLAKSVVVLVMLWFKGDVLSSLFLALRKAGQFQTEVPARALKLMFFLSCSLLECGLSVLTHAFWLATISISSQPFVIKSIFPIIRTFAMFSFPLIDIFPLVMLVTACHMLHTALADANVSLKQQIKRKEFTNPKESLRLRALCFHYIYLRGLHQQLSDILAIPIMSWSLEKVLLLISTTYSFIIYGKFVVGTFTFYLYVMIILMGAVSLYVLCIVADWIADEVGFCCFISK